MLRKIIKIDQGLCNGCGLCAAACHEGAIGMANGKAVLLRDDYCDGLGDCLPVCPTGAIAFEEREALEYNEAEVKQNMLRKAQSAAPTGCPGSAARPIAPSGCPGSAARPVAPATGPEVSAPASDAPAFSQLRQWPVQIKLAPINAPYFGGAHLLMAADCTAYAHGNFHNAFMKNKITLIGCPKLDEGDYSEKLTALLMQNDIKSVTVVRMEVPCCGGIERAAISALQACGKMIPWQVVTLSINGTVLEQ